MRNVEESSLKEGIASINKLTSSYSSLVELISKIDELEIPSLQDLSFKNDKSSLEGFSSILNVVFSIALKPLSLNKREEVIESSSKASGISSEAIRKTLQDSSLWKRYGSSMLPEQVYYFQYYDELITYENIFIITFIEYLYAELESYLKFYISLLGVTSSSLNIKGDEISSSIKDVKRMFHKLDKIKETSFYKRVAKSSKRIKNVIPTNILLHNQNYNAVYKFYKNVIAYDDISSLRLDFSRYYYLLLMKELNSRGFKLVNDVPFFEKKTIILPKMGAEFTKDDISVSLTYINSSFLLKFSKGDLFYTNLLSLSPNEPFIYKEDNKKYDGYDYLSLWHLGYKVNEEVGLFDHIYHDEASLVRNYLDSHLSSYKANEDIYSSYCPVCKQDALNETSNDTYSCPFCGSKYHLEEDNLVFINRRRKR